MTYSTAVSMSSFSLEDVDLSGARTRGGQGSGLGRTLQQERGGFTTTGT